MAEGSEELFIALYTDADIHAKLAGLVRQEGYDAQSALEVGNQTLKDEEQLEYAAVHSRALLTHNIRDFAPLHRKWQEAGRHHAGIVVSQRVGIGELLRRTLRLLNQVTADEMRDNYKHLGEFADRK